MTKKEANAEMRREYGLDWHEQPGGKAKRDALMKGRALHPRARPPARARPPVRKLAPPARKPTPAPKPVKSKRLRVLGGGEIRGTSTRRPFVVVPVAPGKNRAFYMSTGRNTPGLSPTGTWVHFGGMITRGGMVYGGPDDRGGAMAGWFIKPTEAAGSKKAYPKISAKLGRLLGNDPPRVSRVLRGGLKGDFLLVDLDQEDSEGEAQVIRQLNRYLADRKAIDEWQGVQGEVERAHGQRPRHAKTVYGAYRSRFNPEEL